MEGPDMVNIGGYNLPKEFALLYEKIKIWQRHGHIAAGTLLPFLLAIVLPAAIEVLNIVGEMCGTWRGAVTAEILHDWGKRVEGIQKSLNLNVGWLRTELESLKRMH